MDALLERARAQDFHVMIGGIVSENAPSLALHEGLGFEKVAHFKQVGYKFGRWLDLTFMQVVLDTPREPSEAMTPVEHYSVHYRISGPSLDVDAPAGGGPAIRRLRGVASRRRAR